MGALSVIGKNTDPDSLLCTGGETLDMLKLENGVDEKKLVNVVEDVHLFCCSFVKEEVDNEMSVDEVSAFDEEAF